MGSVYKPKGRKHYYIAWLDANGERQVEKAFTDKNLSRRKLVEKEREVERIKAGDLIPGEQHRRKPLDECFDAYLSDLKTRGLTDVYHRDVKAQLERVKKACDWETLGDVTAESLRKHLNSLRERGRGPRTVNLYRDVVGTFCAWAITQGWMSTNPVTIIPKAKNQRGKKTKPRRAYTLEEFHRLTTCPKIPEQRRLIYRLAGLSGLRRSTLQQLQRRDLNPVGKTPTWNVRPEIIKTGWKTPVPMMPECAELILPKWSTLQTEEKLFAIWPRHRTFDRDLARAGITKIGADGRHLDFHSFRYFFCTLMARSLPIQKVRVLMMHRDAKTTLNLYTDLGLIDIGEDVWNLPRLLPGEQEGSEPKGQKKPKPPEGRRGKRKDSKGD